MTLGAQMTPLVIRMTIVSDAATWNDTSDHHFGDSNIDFRSIINDFRSINNDFRSIINDFRSMIND